jgi:hypothetical protein
MRNTEEAWRLVDERGGESAAFSGRIRSVPEPGYFEHRSPDLVARAKADPAARTAHAPHGSPIPVGVEPPLSMSKGAA